MILMTLMYRGGSRTTPTKDCIIVPELRFIQLLQPEGFPRTNARQGLSGPGHRLCRHRTASGRYHINKRAGRVSSCQPSNIIGCFVSFCGLLCQGCDLLWTHYPVVNANVVNQAGPEAARLHSIAGADIHAAFTTFQTVQWFGVPRNFRPINVQMPV
jgi:hypothetical protein